MVLQSTNSLNRQVGFQTNSRNKPVKYIINGLPILIALVLLCCFIITFIIVVSYSTQPGETQEENQLLHCRVLKTYNSTAKPTNNSVFLFSNFTDT